MIHRNLYQLLDEGKECHPMLSSPCLSNTTCDLSHLGTTPQSCVLQLPRFPLRLYHICLPKNCHVLVWHESELT